MSVSNIVSTWLVIVTCIITITSNLSCTFKFVYIIDVIIYSYIIERFTTMEFLLLFEKNSLFCLKRAKKKIKTKSLFSATFQCI